MFRKFSVLLLALLVVSLAAGCAGTGPAPSPVPPTKTPKPTFTPTPDWTPTDIPFPTLVPTTAPAVATEAPAQATAAAATEAAPTVEPTATPAPETRLTAGQTVNVRSGPGTAYPAVGRLNAGDSFLVTGRNDAGDWVKFDFNGKEGWVTAALVTVAGDLNGVEIAEAPAIPTPRPQPTARPRPAQPTAAPQPTQPPAPPVSQFPFQYVQGSANCQPNAGTTYFNGQVKYKNGSLRNGVCVHIAFYGPRQTKCSGCGGVGDGNWGFSPFGGSPPQPGTAVEIYVTSCEGLVNGDKSSFSGPPAQQSDKFTFTLPGGTQCTGITFVGD
jgi:uncharacterized protein YraI